MKILYFARVRQLVGRGSEEIAVPETVRTFGREFPQIQLRLMEELYIAQLTRLRKGEVDVALGPLPDNLPPGEFTVERLMPIGMVVVVAPEAAEATAATLRELGETVYTVGNITARTEEIGRAHV